jgi:hypothetical protein
MAFDDPEAAPEVKIALVGSGAVGKKKKKSLN